MNAVRLRVDPFTALAAFVGMAGLIWMGPLMVDQFVLFADQEQTRRAAESRVLMLPAAALTLSAAAVLLARGRAWHATLVAAPAFVAPAVAWLAPDSLYQLVAFVLLAPLAAGALLSTIVPLPRGVSLLGRLVVVGSVLAFGMVASPFLAMMVVLGAAAWWRLSILDAERASALD